MCACATAQRHGPTLTTCQLWSVFAVHVIALAVGKVNDGACCATFTLLASICY